MVKLGVPHWCNKQIKFSFNNKTYCIPKDCLLMMNMVYANTKANCWKNDKNNGKLN